MSEGIKTTEFGPLDEGTYKHQALLLRSLHCARPVIYQGRSAFIHTISASQAGGHIEMTVYLAVDPAPIDSSHISIAQ